ncbi:MAG: hypothetical protein GX275_12560 [Clostridiales bacterium]|nr:hypothetical protein [Clostridiales bacterium]
MEDEIYLFKLGFCLVYLFYNFFSNKKDKVNNVGDVEVIDEEKNPEAHLIKARDNKYYHVYFKGNSEAATGFIPLTLNPEYKIGSEYNISISTDDDGNVVDDGKIIVIENYIISDENKEKIKNIAGTNYDAATKEIEDKINDVKGDPQK